MNFKRFFQSLFAGMDKKEIRKALTITWSPETQCVRVKYKDAWYPRPNLYEMDVMENQGLEIALKIYRFRTNVPLPEAKTVMEYAFELYKKEKTA